MRKPSPATIIACIALFVALGGAGLAATGNNFILGQSNTAENPTRLTGTVNDGQFRVQNASTTSASRAVVGRMTSASAAAGTAGVVGSTASTNAGAAGVLGINLGGGPAVSATVAPGAAPLSVNSSTKVANLNADLLDGVDRSDLVTRNVSTGTENGPLPVSFPVTTTGRPLLIFLAASGFRVGTPGTIEVDLTIDGAPTPSASTKVYASEAASYRATVPTMAIVNNVPAGVHSVAITMATGGSSDANDLVSYSLIELPPT